ncbi:MAG TPA: sulfite exporter TauE/SafE family protein [Verrucomicrobiae bacterium]|nr:sulfite exporter TauE/SafE family protein [Verrucomicrobiae bacterium]
MSVWTAFILGLLGSLHCAGMCGPLALALPATGKHFRGFVLGRIAYNFGRVLTYCAMGIIFGLVGKTFLLAGIQRWASIALGIILLAGLVTSRRTILSFQFSRWIEYLKSKMGVLVRSHSFWSLLLLGLLNGLLPCGLVYVAGSAAMLAGSALNGAQFMFFFGLGTVPMLLAISLSRNLFPTALRLKLLKLVPVSVFILASLLVLRGLALGIPYLSPDLASGSCCWGK